MTTELKRKFRHKLNLQMFAEDPAAVPPVVDPPVAPKKLDLTQEEFDAKIEERLARERKKFADYDDLKAKVATQEAAEAERVKAAMTEAERIQAEKDAAIKDAEDARTGATEAITKANGRIIKSEFKALARELGVRADALEDAYVLADKAALSVDDDGNVVGAKEAVEALLVAKPFLAESAKPTPRVIGGPNGDDGNAAQKTLEQQLEEAKKAKNFAKVVEIANKLKALKG